MHLLIYNPVSGQSTDELELIIEKFSNSKVDLEVYITQINYSIEDFLVDKIGKYNVVVVAGGDGTISQVMEAMINLKSKASLLIYPRGTTNEYASNVGIDKGNLDCHLQGQDKVITVDLGLFDEYKVFTYSLVFGNFSHVPYETPQWLKNRLGYIAYWIYSFVGLYVFRIKQYQMEFSFNDIVGGGNYLFGSFSNSETLGKVINLDDVSFSDGLLELFLIKAPKSVREVRKFLKDVRTGGNSSGLIITEKITSIEVKSQSKHSWSADGEFSGKFSNLNVKVLPRAINLIVKDII